MVVVDGIFLHFTQPRVHLSSPRLSLAFLAPPLIEQRVVIGFHHFQVCVFNLFSRSKKIFQNSKVVENVPEKIVPSKS
jgi:hypothetical protein